MGSRHRLTALLLGALALAGCATARNYEDPAGPRFAGTYAGQKPAEAIRVVSFNVKYARNVAGAATLLAGDPRLRGADVITLQEMDEKGTDALARALSLNYVYYPSALHPQAGKNFGNAILSPWPIQDDRKIVLPHQGRFRKLRRSAVAATVLVDGTTAVRVVSVHLETPAGLGPQGRRDQAAAVRADAEGYPRAIVAGDFNGRSVVPQSFQGGGFTWLTAGIGRTVSRFSWDHVIVKGLKLRDELSVGTALNTWRVSDHVPVWADVVLE